MIAQVHVWSMLGRLQHQPLVQTRSTKWKHRNYKRNTTNFIDKMKKKKPLFNCRLWSIFFFQIKILWESTSHLPSRRQKSKRTCHNNDDHHEQPWRHQRHSSHQGIHVEVCGFYHFRRPKQKQRENKKKIWLEFDFCKTFCVRWFYLVVFQDSQLDLLALMLDLLWCGVILLLTFLGTTT